MGFFFTSPGSVQRFVSTGQRDRISEDFGHHCLGPRNRRQPLIGLQTLASGARLAPNRPVDSRIPISIVAVVFGTGCPVEDTAPPILPVPSSWTIVSGTALTPDDGILRADPTVVATDDELHLYYGFVPITDRDDPACPVGDARIASSTSTDGLTWNIDDSIALNVGAPAAFDDQGAETPSALIDSDGTFQLFYSGQGDRECNELTRDCAFHLGHATSSDGASFARSSTSPLFPIPFLDNLESFYALTASEPAALLHDGTYYLWFTGMRFDDQDNMHLAVGLATSADGSSWTVRPDPVFTPGPSGTWDDEAVTTASVLHNGSQFVMAYTGVGNRDGTTINVESGSIGLAVSDDGETWTRVGSEPVITAGPTGSWNETGVWGPHLMTLDGEYLIYFGGVRVGETCRDRHAGIGLAVGN